MTDTPEQAQARQKFEAAFREISAQLERLRAAFAELERDNHPRLAWAREQLQRMETVHEVLANTMATGGHIDIEEVRAFLNR
jgi:hypothetical protein